MMSSEDRSYSAREKAWRIAVCFLLVVVVPIVAVTGLVEPPNFGKPRPAEGSIQAWFDTYGAWVVLGVLLVAGIVGVHFLPVGRWAKAGLTALYVPLAVGGIFVFTLAWACHCCGGCL